MTYEDTIQVRSSDLERVSVVELGLLLAEMVHSIELVLKRPIEYQYVTVEKKGARYCLQIALPEDVELVAEENVVHLNIRR